MAILVFARDQRQYNDYVRAKKLARTDAVYASCVNKLRGIFPDPTEAHLLQNWDHSGPARLAMEKAKDRWPNVKTISVSDW